MTAGAVLMVVGAIIGIAGFIYIARNMGEYFADFFGVPGKNRGSNRYTNFAVMAKQHVGGMIVMAIGGLISFTGLVVFNCKFSSETHLT